MNPPSPDPPSPPPDPSLPPPHPSSPAPDLLSLSPDPPWLAQGGGGGVGTGAGRRWASGTRRRSPGTTVVRSCLGATAGKISLERERERWATGAVHVVHVCK